MYKFHIVWVAFAEYESWTRRNRIETIAFATLVLFQILYYLSAESFRILHDAASLSVGPGALCVIAAALAGIPLAAAALGGKRPFARNRALIVLVFLVAATGPASRVARLCGLAAAGDFWLAIGSMNALGPLVLCFFFSAARTRRPGLSFAGAMAAGLLAFGLCSWTLGPAGLDFPPERRLAAVETINAALGAAAGALLLAGLLRHPGGAAPLSHIPRPQALVDVHRKLALRITCATAVFYLVTDSLATTTRGDGVEPAFVLAGLFLLIAGSLLDRGTGSWFRRLNAACGLALMLSPCLELLRDRPGLFALIMTLNVVAQFTFFVCATMAFAYLTSSGRLWYLLVCVPFVCRPISFVGIGGVGEFLAGQPGVRVATAIAGCMLFYHLNRCGRLLFEEAMNRRGGEPGGEAAAPASLEELFVRRGLTARELEVTEKVMHGLSSAEMSEQLAISRHTVDSHVKSILRKFGQPSRKALVAHLAELARSIPTDARRNDAEHPE